MSLSDPKLSYLDEEEIRGQKYEAYVEIREANQCGSDVFLAEKIPTSCRKWGEELLVFIVATTCGDIYSAILDVINQTVFLMDPSAEFALQVSF